MTETNQGDRQPGTAEINREEFSRQAATFGRSAVLGSPAQIQPVLDAAHIEPDDRALDVGCGTGFLTVAAARLASQVVGVDVTPAMLAEAKRRVDEAGLVNVTLREADGETLPFADERFDVVMSRLTLHHCARPLKVLHEMYRVCRPGGRLALCDIIASADREKADLHNRMERLRDPSHVQHYAAAELIRLVESAGFKVVGTHEWQTLRHFEEWTELASVRREVKPALEALLIAYSEGDAAGIQAGRGEDGSLTFTHHWLVVEGLK